MMFCLFIVFMNVFGQADYLPHCQRGYDRFGKFQALYPLKQPDVENILSHFTHNNAGEALYFKQVWLPNNCSTTRFTNETIYQATIDIPLIVVDEMINITTKKEPRQQRYHFVFAGDSLLRGILCGIIRILSGSEIYGPGANIICGGTSFNEGNHLSLYQKNQPHSINFFGGSLTLTFMYITTFSTDHTLSHHLMKSLKTHPTALVFNTGAWDYYTILCADPRDAIQQVCQEALKARCYAPAMNSTLYAMANYAKKHDIRLIYRNNHYNMRFDPNIADECVEKIMSEAGHWEVWDTKLMSKDVWQKETYDGLHIDRTYVLTREEHHKQYHNFTNDKITGMLEMTLAQSLLNYLLT